MIRNFGVAYSVFAGSSQTDVVCKNMMYEVLCLELSKLSRNRLTL